MLVPPASGLLNICQKLKCRYRLLSWPLCRREQTHSPESTGGECPDGQRGDPRQKITFRSGLRCSSECVAHTEPHPQPQRAVLPRSSASALLAVRLHSLLSYLLEPW